MLQMSTVLSARSGAQIVRYILFNSSGLQSSTYVSQAVHDYNTQTFTSDSDHTMQPPPKKGKQDLIQSSPQQFPLALSHPVQGFLKVKDMYHQFLPPSILINMLDFDVRLFHYSTWAILNENGKSQISQCKEYFSKSHCCLFSVKPLF